MDMKFLHRFTKITLLAGGLNLGIVGLSTILNMPFNPMSSLLGLANWSGYINWFYTIVGISSGYLSLHCFKKKDY